MLKTAEDIKNGIEHCNYKIAEIEERLKTYKEEGVDKKVIKEYEKLLIQWEKTLDDYITLKEDMENHIYAS